MASRETDDAGNPEAAMAVATDWGFATVSSSLIALPAAAPGAPPLWRFAAGPPDANDYLPVAL